MNKVAVVCHDAGGAEIISSWLRNNDIQFSCYVEGPAKNIFIKKFKSYSEGNLLKVISDSEWLLTGTSWQSDIENKAIQIARQQNKKSISFLDHWVSYKERFIYKNDFIYPDEIWVGDIYAKEIAERVFYNISVKQKTNEYFVDIINKLKLLKSPIKKPYQTALYVCEPISEPAKIQFGDENFFNYNEKEALKFFLKNLDLFNIKKIMLRPHPSESLDKYTWVNDFTSVPIEISKSRDLLEDINLANLVVGCESMAMVIALMADKRVVSSIPPMGRKCILPHSQIEFLSSMECNNL